MTENIHGSLPHMAVYLITPRPHCCSQLESRLQRQHSQGAWCALDAAQLLGPSPAPATLGTTSTHVGRRLVKRRLGA